MVKMRKRKGRRLKRRGTMKRAFNGGLVRGSLQPRTVSASPWNKLALTSFIEPIPDATKKFFCINISEVRKQLKTELGITDTKITMRFIRVSIWTSPAVAGSDQNFIVLSPADLSNVPACDKPRQANWYEAWGTVVRPAHIHYVWPRSQSVRVVTDNDDGELVLMDLKTTTAIKYIYRFDVLWRPETPDPRPSSIQAVKLISFRDQSPVGYDLCDEVRSMAY